MHTFRDGTSFTTTTRQSDLELVTPGYDVVVPLIDPKATTRRTASNRLKCKFS